MVLFTAVFIVSRLHANLTKGFGIMGPKEFFPLLDFAFMPKNALSSRWVQHLSSRCGLICIDGLRCACPLVYLACLFLCPCCVIILLLLSYPSLQEQLRRLYPRLKVLAFGAKPESTLHTYLPSFLSRATPHCPDDMKREVRESLTHLVTC